MINLYTCWQHRDPEVLKSVIPFAQYFEQNLPNEYHVDYSGHLDWNIFGKDIKELFCNVGVPRKLPTQMNVKHWLRCRAQVYDLLYWVQENLFNKLSVNNFITNYIMIRIFTSKLNKSSIPQDIGDIIHRNTMACYQARNPIYMRYDTQILQELPF